MDDALFVSDAIQSRPVTLADGSVQNFHFRSAPAKLWRRYALADAKSDSDEFDNAAAALISASLCEEDGSPALTAERALTLKPLVSAAILREINALNGAAGKG